MAQPNAIVSYDQPFNHNLQTFEHFLMCNNDDSPPLNFTELPSPLQQNEFLIAPTRFQSTVVDLENVQPNESLLDPLILENDHTLEEGFQTNPTQANGTNDFGNPIQLSSWPLQVPPYTCSCCHILREIIHTNGDDITKLEVHGRLGLICHAVLEKYSIVLTTNQGHEYTMFDFCKETITRVKQFLRKYCKERKISGYVMLQDPLSSFYEAVCVGLDWDDNLSTGTDDLIPDDSGDHQTNNPGVETSSARHNNKTTLSMQRERTGKLTMKDLVDHFHIPIEVAAKKIHVCPTVIKKICRKHGLSRWPYRKIRSIERKISTRVKGLASLDAEVRIGAQAEITTLRNEITNIYAGFIV